jgi:hypothetical protein
MYEPNLITYLTESYGPFPNNLTTASDFLSAARAIVCRYVEDREDDVFSAIKEKGRWFAKYCLTTEVILEARQRQ